MADLFTSLAGVSGPGAGDLAISPDVDATASSSGLGDLWAGWLRETGRGSPRAFWGLGHRCAPLVVGAQVSEERFLQPLGMTAGIHW